jgi:sugar phosphate isomerase/epimerase
MSINHSRREFLHRAAMLAAGTAGAALAPRNGESIEPIVRKGGSRLKLSCCAYSYRQFLSGPDKSMTLEDFIEMGAEMGLDAVELTAYYFPGEITAEYLNRLKHKAFLFGLDISGTAVGSRFCNLPGQDRERNVSQIKQWVDYSAALGAPCIRVFGGNVPKGASLEQAQKWAIECIEECCEYSGKRGVFLALENHGGITASPTELLPIVQGVKSDWFGVNLDTGNFRTADPYGDIATMAPYAITAHVKTEIGGRPADFKRIIQILQNAGYRGYIALEYEAKENPKTAVPRTVKALRKLLG